MEGADVEVLRGTLIALAVVLTGRAVIAWAQEAVARRCSAAVKSSLRLRLLRHVALNLPDLQDGRASGEVAALTTRGLDSLDAYFGRYLPQVALAVIVPIVVLACLATSDAVATITVALTLPIIPFFMALIGSYTVRRRQRRWEALARLSGHFLDVVAGLATLRIFGRAEAQLGRLERVTDDYRRESMETLRIAFLSAFALEMAATLSVAMVAVGVGLRLVDGLMALQTGLFVLILAPEAYLPLRQLGASYHASEEGLEAAGRVFAIIERAEPGGEDPDQTASASTATSQPGALLAAGVEPGPGGEIRIVGVTVRQPGRGIWAPFEASLTLRPGEIAGLAGPSGVGKSTLIDVLLGLRTPDAGSVELVDAGGTHVPVASFNRASWHRQVAWVPQHPYCFPGTLADNVRLGAPDATDSEVREALRTVGMAELDLEAPIGEGGTGLSSGQRRRLGVARALLKPARILILDEPTAGLDTESEATVLAAVRTAARSRGQAVLLVAHRPAALQIADCVVTIESRTEVTE